MLSVDPSDRSKQAVRFGDGGTMRQARSVTLGLLVLTLAVAARDSSSATASPNAPRMLVGVHQDAVAHSYDHARAAIRAARDRLNVQVSRSTLRWNLVERSRGEFEWSHADLVVAELEAAGIEPLFALIGSPTWANGVDAGVPNSEFYVPVEQASFNRWLTGFTTFAREAARRYREVSLWEVWNEPNEHFFWLPRPNSSRYAQVYRAVSNAIHTENPKARVAVGGLSGIAAGCCISGLDFTRRLIASGIEMDAVALHPYPSNGHPPDVHVQWEDNFDDIGKVRQLLDASGLRQVEVWVTEWGWSSGSGPRGAERQATYTTRSLEMLRDQFSYVSVAIIFLDADRPGYDHGLLTASFEPKPAGLAFLDFQRSRLAATPLKAPARKLATPNATKPFLLVVGGFWLTAKSGRVGKPFGATMRVIRSDTGKPLADGVLVARATVQGRRLELVRKGAYRGTLEARWLLPAWAKDKTISGSITVRYGSATVTKRFGAHVR